LGEVPPKEMGSTARTARKDQSMSILDQIATKTDTTPTNATSRPDLPPLIAYDGQSLWAKIETNNDGEMTATILQTLPHPIGKTGAGLNAALDRIFASFAKRENKGFGALEGFELVTLGVVPAQPRD